MTVPESNAAMLAKLALLRKKTTDHLWEAPNPKAQVINPVDKKLVFKDKSEKELHEMEELERNWFSIRRLSNTAAGKICHAIRDNVGLQEGTQVRKIDYITAAGGRMARVYLYPGVTEIEAARIQKAINVPAVAETSFTENVRPQIKVAGGHYQNHR